MTEQTQTQEPQLKKLTPEHLKRLDEIRDEWIGKGVATEKVDREKAVEAAKAAYRLADLEPPDLVFWFESPMAGARKVAQLVYEKEDVTEDQAREQLWHACYGQHESWVAFYAAFKEFGVKECEPLTPYMELAETGWWWPLDGAIVMCERPEHVATDEEGRLHCEDRAAIEWTDGWGVYAWHGARVPKWIIVEPEKITPELIDKEENAEVRRVMLERYGEGRYMEDSGCEVLQEDRYGKLIFKAMDGEEEDMLMVRVVNSTAEPDGSFNIYYLRIPPNEDIKTAHAGVAWTFGKTPEEYDPLKET
jgi:hypothetical protein